MARKKTSIIGDEAVLEPQRIEHAADEGFRFGWAEVSCGEQRVPAPVIVLTTDRTDADVLTCVDRLAISGLYCLVVNAADLSSPAAIRGLYRRANIAGALLVGLEGAGAHRAWELAKQGVGVITGAVIADEAPGAEIGQAAVDVELSFVVGGALADVDRRVDRARAAVAGGCGIFVVPGSTSVLRDSPGQLAQRISLVSGAW